jgi:hypothetical protein
VSAASAVGVGQGDGAGRRAQGAGSVCRPGACRPCRRRGGWQRAGRTRQAVGVAARHVALPLVGRRHVVVASQDLHGCRASGARGRGVRRRVRRRAGAAQAGPQLAAGGAGAGALQALGAASSAEWQRAALDPAQPPDARQPRPQAVPRAATTPPASHPPAGITAQSISSTGGSAWAASSTAATAALARGLSSAVGPPLLRALGLGAVGMTAGTGACVGEAARGASGAAGRHSSSTRCSSGVRS